jgi:hypothetical protein
MYYSYELRTLVLGILLFIYANRLACQVHPVFDQLDLSPVSSGFLYPQIVPQPSLPNTLQGQPPLSAKKALQLIAQMDKACLDSSNFIDDFESFYLDLKSSASELNCRPMCIMDIAYHDFKTNAFQDGLVYFSDNKLHNNPNALSSPWEEKETLIFWIDAEQIPGTTAKFILQHQGYVSNRNEIPDNIEIDFDDGLGYREIDFDVPIEVSYSELTEDKVIKVKLHRSDLSVGFGYVKSGSNEEHDPCDETVFPFPHAPLWPTDGEGTWSISTLYNGEPVKGNAYVLNSADNVFDKPFIFVEGIDFGVNKEYIEVHDTHIHGSFGWCAFTSGFTDPNPDDEKTYDYGMLKLMPELLHELRLYGYDMVLLDFYDGADYIEKNSALLQKLIGLCNDFKTGGESLIVSGASMGGQVSRHALATMESQGIDHCARTWISLDSPHCGANIPLSLQYAVDFLAEVGSVSAIQAKHLKLLRPASRQMLNLQALSDLNLRNSWYSNLDELGYPELCKSVAIANGRGNGIGITNVGDPLINWSCATDLNSPFKVLLHHSSGDPYASNIPGQSLIFHMRIPSLSLNNLGNDGWYAVGLGFGWVWGLGAGSFIDFMDIEEQKRYVPTGTPNWDDGAGGLRESIFEFAEDLNDEFADIHLDGVCPLINLDGVREFHSFVSTASALGLESNDPLLHVNNYILDHSEDMKFDNWMVAGLDNEEHVEVTHENIQFILEEVLGWEYSGLENALTAGSLNNGVFNYGKRSFTEIRDINIYNGGRLNFNNEGYTHFNEPNDNLSSPVLLKFSTPTCTPATIYIGNNGLVNIGDQFNSAYQAEVHIRRDSKIIVDNGGVLRINAGSKLIIHEGAELTLEAGATLEVNNGKIEILSGGVMNVFGAGLSPTIHKIKLNGNDACIAFGNGKLQLSDHVTFTLDTTVDETGFVEILPGSENTLLTEVGSKLVFEGKGQDDVVLRINNYAHLQNANFATGDLIFKNCKVDLNNFGAIYTDMPTTIDRANFVANEFDITHGGSIVVWYSACQVKSSNFNQVKLMTKFSKLSVHESAFNDAKSGIMADNGAFEVKGSNFNIANIHSEGLQSASLIENCHFQGGINSQVLDKSLVELFVKGNLFAYASEYGIEKKGGKLSASCNMFNSVQGIKIAEGDLNMSSNNGAGHNVFNHTPRCILLDNAASVDLIDGFNDFSGFEFQYIKGTINMLCGENNCFPEINADGNCWGLTSDGSVGVPDSPVQPDQQYFDVTTTIVVPCAGYENSNACSVAFYDRRPVLPKMCPEKVRLVVRTKMASGKKSDSDAAVHAKDNSQDESNPILNVGIFQGITLDSALVYAASMSEAYDTLGSDLNAIDLLHQILTSDLDFYNIDIRSKMNWARYVMKSAVERMFLHGELNEINNITAFEMPVQQYVDVLNLMTDTALTDSTYLDQFYLELDKGQLFRTIGNRETALTVFEHLGDCQLDSLEQMILEEWRIKTELEIDMNDLYLVQNVPADSILMSTDSIGYGAVFNLEVSDYYFGLWIDAPQSVTFVSCGNDPVYRDAWSRIKLFDVFPNPSGNFINIISPEKDTPTEVQLWDTQGRRLMTEIVTGEFSLLRWPAHIAAGTYVLRISNHEIVEDHLIMISQE